MPDRGHAQQLSCRHVSRAETGLVADGGAVAMAAPQPCRRQGSCRASLSGVDIWRRFDARVPAREPQLRRCVLRRASEPPTCCTALRGTAVRRQSSRRLGSLAEHRPSHSCLRPAGLRLTVHSVRYRAARVPRQSACRGRRSASSWLSPSLKSFGVVQLKQAQQPSPVADQPSNMPLFFGFGCMQCGLGQFPLQGQGLALLSALT